MAKTVTVVLSDSPTNHTPTDDLSGNFLSKNPSPISPLTPNELTLWLTYIEHQVGFILPASQNNWVQNTIERYLRRYQMTTTELLARLPHDITLYHQFFDDILIPRTQFFRHLPTFKFIESYARQFQLKNIQDSPNSQYNQPNRAITPFTAWSVGCSSGQEPVSMALSLAKALGVSADFEIFGSDFHQKSLSIAQQGQYDVSQLADIPSLYQGYLERKISSNLGSVNKELISLKPELARHLAFFSDNLVNPSEELPIALGSCQLILCKNVLIYFRQFDQRDIINRLVGYLAEDGVLILGAGELPNLNNPQLKKLPYPQINGFCKINSPIWLEQLYLGD